MKLTRKQMVTISFMLFSLFFGAGNLIFPPFLGQNAASATLPAIIGFLLTAVVLPVLGVIVVAIFTLACLTTCVGLINSISQFFSIQFPRLTYHRWVCVIVVFSFLICNLGLNAILSISIPVLNAIYPVSIVLILLGLTDNLWQNNPCVYPLTIGGTACVSILYAMDTADVPLGFVGDLCRRLPLYSMGFCWVSVAAVMLLISFALQAVKKQ